MAEKRKKRPRDPLALAKMIGDIATGQVTDESSIGPLSERGRKGGEIGGPKRALNLTPEQRSKIAQHAARARWKKTN
jgi:hypothetical protein